MITITEEDFFQVALLTMQSVLAHVKPKSREQVAKLVEEVFSELEKVKYYKAIDKEQYKSKIRCMYGDF